MNTPLQFCEEAVRSLESCEPSGYSKEWCRLKVDFFHLFQRGLIFSTRFGADFFSEVLSHLKTKAPLKAPVGEKLGEFDENFNKWLRMV